ncbi:Cytochrome P450 [Amanita muscaria]
MIDLQALLVIVFCALSSIFLYTFSRTRKLHAPYPPGPPAELFVGNAFDIPFKKAWIRYLEWSRQFNSDIIHLSALNVHIVVINTLEGAVELLDRRSANYSSRPSNIICKLLGIQNITALLPYGNTLRKHRRIMDEDFKKQAVTSYHSIHARKVEQLLYQLLQEPAGFNEHIKMLGTSITMAVTCGYDLIPNQRDKYVEMVEFTVNVVKEMTMLGSTLVTVFEFLGYIPPWVPGATTQRICADAKDAITRYKDGLFRRVKACMAAGTQKDCMVARLLERHSRGDNMYEDEEMLKDAMLTIYMAGVETMHVAKMSFVLAMVLYPQVQARAQEEIDRVVGSDRLPTFEDRDSLPYVEALYREVHRWRPVTPLGLVHSTVNDDVYKGFHIPAGSFIFANIWAITRNEEKYPDPEAFQPQRFMKADGTLGDENINYSYGFGRRICPGRHMADQAVWLMIVSILATFKISKAKDENGNEIDVDPYACTDGATNEPLPFKCSMVPRSPQAESLIMRQAPEMNDA